jgi:hypothetical protein
MKFKYQVTIQCVSVAACLLPSVFLLSFSNLKYLKANY